MPSFHPPVPHCVEADDIFLEVDGALELGLSVHLRAVQLRQEVVHREVQLEQVGLEVGELDHCILERKR